MKLLGISGTIVGSKTGIAVQSVLDAAKQFYPEIETEYLDMKDYQVQFCDGRDPSAYTGDTKTVIDIVSSADCYIIGTPIFPVFDHGRAEKSVRLGSDRGLVQ